LTRKAEYSNQFERDIRLAERRGQKLEKLKRLLILLVEQQPLPRTYKDHPLKGNWGGYRDAHIEPDWVLIYKIAGDTVRFERTGRHSDLFDE